MKDVNAAAIAVDRGWKTDAQIAADYGTDIDENIAEAQRLKPLKESAGLLTAKPKVETPKGKEHEDGKEEEN